MNIFSNKNVNRRNFIQFLAASPLIASYLGSCSSEKNVDAIVDKKVTLKNFGESSNAVFDLIKSADEALSVWDFRALAKEKLDPAHWGYLQTGVDDNLTLQKNEQQIKEIKIRPRRLVDVRNINMETEIFGRKWKTPIVLAPVAAQMAFYLRGELNTARAAKSRNHLMILSNYTSKPIEDVVEARGEPVWFQLYPADIWDVTNSIIKRAEDAGSPALVVTVDSQPGGNREFGRRSKKKDGRSCIVCHQSLIKCKTGKPMIDDLEYEGIPPTFTWDYIEKLKKSTKMKVLIKGIVTGNDAELCVNHGVDGIIVSNHGGRAEESGRATIDCLPEVISAVKDKIPVIIDGGFRRGTDIFKALALGARAVAVGRPYLWGLSSFGQEGVEAVLDILTAELKRIMKQAGTPSLSDINTNYIRS